MNKKAQAALEFLTTYGWAILVVMVAIGALAYFGVLNPNKTLPDRSVFGNGLTSQDTVITKDTSGNYFARVKLMNSLGKTLYIENPPKWSSNSVSGNCRNTVTSVISEGIFEVVCPISGISAQDKLKVNIDVTFKQVQGGLTQISKGEIYSQIQETECNDPNLYCSDGIQNCGERGVDCDCDGVCPTQCGVGVCSWIDPGELD